MSRRPIRFPVVACLLVLLGATIPTLGARAASPDSPEVRAMLKEAMAFLNSKQALQHNHMDRLGGLALLGYTIFHQTHDADHPLVVLAVRRCQDVAQRPSAQIQRVENTNYSLGIATLFLCTVDAEAHRAEIKKLLAALLANQQGGGAWGYLVGPDARNGDTSQSQYGVLASWKARQSGFEVDQLVFDRALRWLIRTQDPSGAFGYTPIDPGDGPRRRQPKISLSLTSAGAGSAYICGHALGMFESSTGSRRERKETPELLEVGKKPATTTTIPLAALLQSTNEANRWVDGNFRLQRMDSLYYMMYALERYMTFRDLAAGVNRADPEWYKAGVSFLSKDQNADGSWESRDNGKTIATCFAVLFLMRSTTTITDTAVTSEGVLQSGGRVLPKDVSGLRENSDGRIVDSHAEDTLDELLQLLEADVENAKEWLNKKLPLTKIEHGDVRKRDAQMELLKQKVSHKNYAVRLASVRLLATQGDVDVAPALIYALSDPDPDVARAARDGLRLLSRKFDGFRLGDEPTASQVASAQQAWRSWYKSIRTDAKFVID